MIGFNGGLIGGLANARNTSTAKSIPGVWTMEEQRKAVFSVPRVWPTSETFPAIGEAFGGGFFVGYISHTQDGVATHGLIVAPRATGASGTDYPVTTNYQWKTATTSTTDTTSLFDGVANTAAMVADNIANHPAANFCVNLTLGGFTDWYLPSQLELDIAYENLKPSTTNNVTSTGTNAYSVPKRTSNRTAGVPAQTSVLAFRTGGAEAFVANGHWSSSQLDATNGRNYFLGDGFPSGASKTSSTRVRAFRRIPV